MKKNDSDFPSSLDLLLDTMCNLFGGIVLIALLLALFSKSTASIKPQPVVKDEQGVGAVTSAQQEAELTKLTQQKKILENIARSDEGSGAAPVLLSTQNLARVVNLKIEQEKLSTTLSNQTSLATNLQLQIVSCQSNAIQFTSENQVLSNTIAELKQQLTVATNVVHRELRMPLLHEVKMTSVFLAVKDGKLYAISDVSTKRSPYARRGYNKQDIIVEHGPEREDHKSINVVTFVPERGQKITQGSERYGTFAQALALFDKAIECVTFCVHPNSFKEFNYIKKFFVNYGFQYYWQPLTSSYIEIVPAESIEAL